MAFLLLKILGLLLLAALLGAMFMRWWLGRDSVDVTEDYVSMREDWAQWRRSIEAKLASPSPVDFSSVHAAIASIKMPEPTPATDLAPVQARLAELERAVKGIVIPAATTVDLAPVSTRLGALETRLGALRIPEPTPATDLAPVQARLAELERAVKGIVIPAATMVDLAPVSTRLGALETRLGALRIPEPTPATDLAPVQARLAELERAVKGIVIPAATTVDLAPLLARFESIDKKIDRAARKPARSPAIPASVIRAGSRNLLSAPAFGRPDDLKRIKGVAKVLERMLHGVGVYYFWQIADWNAQDVVHVDKQLTAFKGRIKRDGWVAQAAQFARGPDAARRPADG